MATITKRGPSQFEVRVRRKGYPAQHKTFETKKDAEAWAAVIESEVARGVFIDRTEAEQTTLGDLLAKYMTEVTPSKRGGETEAIRIKRLRAQPLAARSLASLRGIDIARYRDERLKTCQPATVRRELVILSAVFEAAQKDWSIAIDNPVRKIRKPSPGKHRERRLSEDEEARLLAEASPMLQFCIRLALATGMRAGEISNLSWSQIDLRDRVIRLDLTKNGEGRVVPLSESAEAAIRELPRGLGKVTTYGDRHALTRAMSRACERASIENFRFHDLRHEAASRMAPHLPIATLCKIFGWATMQMAARYYNPTADELVEAVRSIKRA